MKKIFNLLFFILILENSFSQNEKQINSIKRRLPSLHDSAKIDCLNELSDIYLGFPKWFADDTKQAAQTDAAESLISESLTGAEKINYTYGIAKSLSLKAVIEFEKYENFSQAERYCREAIYYYKKSANKKDLYKTYWRLGQALYSVSKFNDAINNLDTCFDLSKKSGDSLYALTSIILSYNNSFEKGDYAKAFEKL